MASRKFFPHQIADHLVRVHKTPINSPELAHLPSQSHRLKNLLAEPPSSENKLMPETHIRNILKNLWPIPFHKSPCSSAW